MQSKQVSASASRSIVNYRLTCGFFASVLPAGCAERGQAGWLNRAVRLRFARREGVADAFSAAAGVPPAWQQNALDLIRRAVSDRNDYPYSKGAGPKRIAQSGEGLGSPLPAPDGEA
jgi:hypothetical protein